MTSMRQVRKLARSQDKAARLACRQLDRLWRKTTAKTKDPAKLSQLMQQTVPQLVAKYGDVASSAAMEWYRNVSGHGYEPVMADPVDPDKVDASVRWAMGAAYDDQEDGESTDSGLAGAQSRLGEVVDRNVRQAGRDTLVSNANRDRRAKGWAIVPSGTACAYCVMLASRGATYTSEDTAESSVHAHCSCEVVPDFGDGIDGYDPEKYYDMYESAAAQAGVGASPKDIAAELRRMYPTQITDGVTASADPIIGDDWDGGIIKPSEAELEELGKRVNGKYTVKQKNAALREWTGSYFQGLQNRIYRGEKLDIGARKTMAELDEALTDHTTSETFTVDRYGDPRIFGIRDPHEVDKLRNGKITDPNAGYLANSLDAGGHGVGVRPGEGVRIRILLPPGTHCAYLQNVTQVKEEHEILLPRGVKLKIIDHGIDKDYERWVHAVLVSDGQS